MNRVVCAALAALALSAFGSGCCCMDRYYYGDCARPAMWGRYGGGGVSDGCADGSCHGGSCNAPACSTPDCGDCGRCDLCCFNPLRSLFSAIHCSSGCGEFYYDEWINDPPDACDPCDDCGNYVGPRCCPPRWFLGVRNMCGYRCGRTCDTSCGYESGCGAPGCTSCGHGDAHHEEAMHGDVIESVPTPAPEPPMMPSTSRRPAKTYYNNKSATQTAGHTQTETTQAHRQPTPAVRRTSHTTPTTAKSPIGSGVRRR